MPARLPGDLKMPAAFDEALAAVPAARAEFEALDFETRRHLCDTINAAEGCGARSILIRAAIRELLAGA